jgi:hypothetical protein
MLGEFWQKSAKERSGKAFGYPRAAGAAGSR